MKMIATLQYGNNARQSPVKCAFVLVQGLYFCFPQILAKKQMPAINPD
jgi:hypothetical protein